MLGLSQSTIDTIDGYVKSQLHPLSDGSVGLDLGVEFPLIGSGSPLSTLTFTYLPGTVVYQDFSGVSAQLVPEPPSWMLIITGLVGLLSFARVKHRNC